MPPSPEILQGLSAIANERRDLAIGWHLALASIVVAVVLGWRPPRRAMGLLLAAPAASVSLLAWVHHNSFNGTVFALLAVALATVALCLPPARLQIGHSVLALPGAVLLAFGWVYPHFLATDSWTAYLYAAPLGLIPCPTLAVLVGSSLLTGGLGSRAWSLIVAGAALVYGFIGAFRLGVAIDLVLLVGAVILTVAALVTIGGGSAAHPATPSV